MDNDYLRKRQERSVRERPKHVGEGLLLGARDLGLGIFQGITGKSLLMKFLIGRNYRRTD